MYAGTVTHSMNRTDERLMPYAPIIPKSSQSICDL
jgi:hypothetical protein